MSRQQLICHLTGYLLLFGVELEALVQCAAVVLDMLLLLIPHALCVLHHLLLDVAKQAAGPRQGNGTLWRLHMQNSQVEVVSGLVLKGIETNIWYVKTHTHTLTSLWLCAPTRWWASHGEVHRSYTASVPLMTEMTHAWGTICKVLYLPSVTSTILFGG